MSTERKTIQLVDVFSYSEVNLAAKIIAEHGRAHSPERKTVAEKIEEQVTRPALDRINKVTGQQNNARYWAYALEHAITSSQKK
jgi:hypothetical protein